MAEETEWAAYLYPGTTILRNKLGLQDERLWEAERFLVTRRAEQIHAGLVDIPRTFDGEHLKAIHSHLACDIYSWAGEYRNVTLAKRNDDTERVRVFLSPNAIDPFLKKLGVAARDVDWSNLSRDDLVQEISELQTWVNLSHPFREVNGRSTRIFLDHVVENSSYKLDFDRVESDEWNAASRDGIHPGMIRPKTGVVDFEPAKRVFEKIVVDRRSVGDMDPFANARAAVRVAMLGHAAPASEVSRTSQPAESAMSRPTMPVSDRGLGR